MEITNQQIMHKKYGEGKVVSFSDKYVIVQFSNVKKKFVYPDAFALSLQAADPIIQALIIEEIKNKDEEGGTCIIPEPPIVGKQRIFYVFQGKTFGEEFQGGYIWAPITSKAGSNNIHHWNRLLEVREGDIILHGCSGSIVAISRAKGPCYESPRPDEFGQEESWDKPGRRVDCEYCIINRPITTSYYKDEIIKFSADKYSPFDKNGNGNMGYLYKINRELAHFFITETVKSNMYLSENPVIQDFFKDNDSECENK